MSAFAKLSARGSLSFSGNAVRSKYGIWILRFLVDSLHRLPVYRSEARAPDFVPPQNLLERALERLPDEARRDNTP